MTDRLIEFHLPVRRPQQHCITASQGLGVHLSVAADNKPTVTRQTSQTAPYVPLNEYHDTFPFCKPHTKLVPHHSVFISAIFKTTVNSDLLSI
jgi:hypothetical protein